MCALKINYECTLSFQTEKNRKEFQHKNTYICKYTTKLDIKHQSMKSSKQQLQIHWKEKMILYRIVLQ